jgi:hypothetical protein
MTRRSFAIQAAKVAAIFSLLLGLGGTVGLDAGCGSCGEVCESTLDIGLSGSRAAFPPGQYRVEVDMQGHRLTCSVQLVDPAAGFVGGNACEGFYLAVGVRCPNGSCDPSHVVFDESISLDPLAFGAPPALVVVRQSVDGVLRFANVFAPTYVTNPACDETCTDGSADTDLD